MRHVVNANLNQLLLFELPITIKSNISKPPDEIKESFEGLLLGIVKSEDGNLFLPMKILGAETFNHVIPSSNGTWL